PTPAIATTQSQQKLKFVEWEKIHRRQLDATVWEHLNDNTIVSQLSHADVFNQIEKSFAQKRPVEVRKRKTDTLELLDSKKAYNMSIFLTGLAKDFEIHRLKEYLRDMAPVIQVEHVLENLIKFVPSLEEASALKKYKESGESLTKLSKADQLALEMMQVDQFKQRVECLLYKLLFWDTIERIEKDFDTVLRASDELLNAESFKQLLQMILVLGNFMNGNTSRGGAFGIKITSINKEAQDKLTRVEQLQKDTEQSFEKVVCFYGENIQRIQPIEFFRIFYVFVSSWQKCTNDLRIAKQTKERLESQKRFESDKRNQNRMLNQPKGKGIDMSD
ncbi:hypothetical protein CU098_003624, partial [Rhizopus stolonifer]